MSLLINPMIMVMMILTGSLEVGNVFWLLCRQMEGHLKHIMACVSNFEFPPPGGDVKKIEPGEIFPFELLGDIFLTCAQLEVTKQVVLHYQAEDKQSPFQHLG